MSSNKYQISANSGNVMGIFSGDTPAEALLACHREAGYGEDVVWLHKDGKLAFADDDAWDLCGGVDDWFVEEVPGE